MKNQRKIFQRIRTGIKVGYYDLKLKVSLKVLIYFLLFLILFIMIIYIISVDLVVWALDNEGGPEVPNNPSSPSHEAPDNSPSPTSSRDDGYETDSNRSYLEQGADAMMVHPVQDIPDHHLERYNEDLKEIAADPEYWDTPEERQIFVDRQREIQEELDRRNPDSSGSKSDTREESFDKDSTKNGSSNTKGESSK